MGEDSIQSLHDIERIAAEASGKGDRTDSRKYRLPDRVRRDAKPPMEGETVGDFNIRIGRDGTWFYRGSPINRLPLVKLFASVLRRGDDGTYLLVTPVERGTILVEDAPFVAVDMDIGTENASDGKERTVLTFRTNLDEIMVAGPDHPIRVEIDAQTGEPCPYIRVRDGLDALIARSVFYRMVEMAEERAVAEGAEVELGVSSQGVFFPLGRVNEETTS
ncbi:MAG: DUF1285 domain-containing protein [Alphaproteobacteria bacterium]|nr:DUF1285 domain-containing protein [Alphaproteobacteria bacterium]